MKKLIAGLFAAILTTAGLVAVTSTAPATAAKCGTKYNPCVKTKTTAKAVKKVIKRGKKAKVRVVVRPASGNAPVIGNAVIVIKGGGKTIRKTVKVRNGKVNYTTPKLRKKGKYRITVTFRPTGKSNNLASKSKTFVIRVR